MDWLLVSRWIRRKIRYGTPKELLDETKHVLHWHQLWVHTMHQSSYFLQSMAFFVSGWTIRRSLRYPECWMLVCSAVELATGVHILSSRLPPLSSIASCIKYLLSIQHHSFTLRRSEVTINEKSNDLAWSGFISCFLTVFSHYSMHGFLRPHVPRHYYTHNRST